MTSVGRISLDLGINQKQFNKQVNNIQKETTKSFGLLSIAVGNIFADMATRAVASMGSLVKDTLDKGSEIAELENVVGSVFTTMADDVEAFSKSALEAYGLNEAQAKRMVGTYGAMSKSFGYTEKQAYAMSTALTGLTGDVASFYNLNIDEAYTKLKSVFTGETESLKELGVVMTQTALDEFAMAKGMGKTTNQMSEQEKVALRLAFVQDKLNVAAGDFTRTQSQWANQTRILSGQFDSLKAEIGQGLINVLTPVIRLINTLMQRLIQLAATFKSFTAMIMGQSKGGGAGAAMAEVAEAAANAAESTGGIESSAEGAAKAAKKAQKSLMGFDEINKLTAPDTSGSSEGGAGASDFDFELPTFEKETEEAKKSTSTFAKMLKQISFKPLKNEFKKLKSYIMPIVDTISEAITWMLENVLAPLAKWTIEDALPAFFSVLSGVLSVLNPLLKSLKPALSWLWEKFLVPVGKWTGGVVTTVLKTIGDLLERIGNWMTKNQPVVDAITTALLGFFAAWKLTQLAAFIQMSGGVIAALTGITTAVIASTVAKAKDIAQTVVLTALYAKDFVVSVVQGTAALAKQAAQWVVTTAAKVTGTAAIVASTVATTAATAATWLFNAALAVLTSPITLVIAAVAALVAGIVLLIKNFDSVKAAAKNAFTAIANAIKSIINGILSNMEAMINGIISGMNFMIRKINGLSVKIPSWVPSVGGKKLGFSINEIGYTSLPRLAEGGYVRANQPQPVIVGDNKTQGEIISPEGKMFDVMLQALQAFFSKLQESGIKANSSDVGDITIPIYLDGTLLDEVIVTANQRRALRSGGY